MIPRPLARPIGTAGHPMARRSRFVASGQGSLTFILSASMAAPKLVSPPRPVWMTAPIIHLMENSSISIPCVAARCKSGAWRQTVQTKRKLLPTTTTTGSRTHRPETAKWIAFQTYPQSATDGHPGQPKDVTLRNHAHPKQRTRARSRPNYSAARGTIKRSFLVARQQTSRLCQLPPGLSINVGSSPATAMIDMASVAIFVMATVPMGPWMRRMTPISAMPRPAISHPTPFTANPDVIRPGRGNDHIFHWSRRWSSDVHFRARWLGRHRDASPWPVNSCFTPCRKQPTRGQQRHRFPHFEFVHNSLFFTLTRVMG